MRRGPNHLLSWFDERGTQRARDPLIPSGLSVRLSTAIIAPKTNTNTNKQHLPADRRRDHKLERRTDVTLAAQVCVRLFCAPLACLLVRASIFKS